MLCEYTMLCLRYCFLFFHDRFINCKSKDFSRSSFVLRMCASSKNYTKDFHLVYVDYLRIERLEGGLEAIEQTTSFRSRVFLS